MLASQVPTKFPIIWGASAGGSYIRTIPNTSQIGVNNGWASFPDGFPPLCFLPVGSGGVPPFGQDMNGILGEISAWSQWQAAGGLVKYDGTFSGDVGGYPQGAVLASASPGGVWISTADSNTSNPDAGGANWVNLGKLTGNTTYYVNPVTGSDSNSGTSSGNAWATLAHAWTWMQQNVDAAGYTITISCAHPNSPTSYAVFQPIGGITGVFSPQQIVITGDLTSQNCQISVSVGGGAVSAQNALFTIEGFTLINSAMGGIALNSSNGSQIIVGSNVYSNSAFGLFASNNSSISAIPSSTNTFTGTVWNSLFQLNNGCQINVGNSVVDTNATVSTATVVVADAGVFYAISTTFGGAGVTGSRFLLSMCGLLDTNGSQPLVSTAYIPGSSNGSTGTGGQFR